MTASERISAIYGEAGLERARRDQAENLLPQLLAKVDKLTAKRTALDELIAEIEQAVDDIRDGKITDYQLRKTRKKAAEK